MFILNFFKILFILFFVIIIYNLIKMAIFVKKSKKKYNESKNNINEDMRTEKVKFSRKGKKEKIIELDKDQYKVE